MTDQSNTDINLASFRIVRACKKQLKERYVAPFRRVMPEYRHLFKKEHKVVKMPADWYELFHRSSRN